MNDYEEVYIDTVSYSTYERDLQQKDSEIDKLQIFDRFPHDNNKF